MYIYIYLYIIHGSYGFQSSSKEAFDKPFLSDVGEQALMKPIFYLEFFRRLVLVSGSCPGF